ncbi:MAG: Dicer-like protein 1 [Pycnora praestabilis]|nr:MAG: Dicer-like protein 1 [Pycnora praestabilis]
MHLLQDISNAKKPLWETLAPAIDSSALDVQEFRDISVSKSRGQQSEQYIENEQHSEGFKALGDFVTTSMKGAEPESSGTDTDEEEGEQALPNLHEMSQRRRVQTAKFKSWFSNRAETIGREEAKASFKAADDDSLSTRNLMAKQESTVIISDPREYQIELFEKAKKQNIIAVLDTGSGKTLIAVLLLRYVLDQELEDRSIGKPHRVSFFLVDCVTLVFQQFAVLECNLDQKIERICGDMGCDLWVKATWRKVFSQNMVIVCTAEVLYQCLMHSFITIDQINLLIFDEAHHAKKNHSYARIIKDFYLAQTDEAKRPRIFGMTASPVDARVDIVEAAKGLETLLHCQIATTSDLSLLQKSVSRPLELMAVYDPLPCQFETPLHQQLKLRFGKIQVFVKLFLYSKEASSELGAWCADQLWSFGLAEEEARKMESKIERTFLARKDPQPVEMLDADIASLREARAVVAGHQFHPPTAISNDLSSKVLLLRHYLNLVFERPSAAKCIVFVKRRYTARLLVDLFTRIGTPCLRSGILIGTRTGDAGDLNTSFRKQVLTLMKFRKGELNCLFATSIAEEGLDIPDCNLVVRFDLYGTLIQYIQSRGRARHANSKYVHMVERNNKVHHQAVTDVRSAETVMRQFCKSLPADRLLQGNDYDLDESLIGERSLRTYTEVATGAKLTYGSSLAVLAHFVVCLPCDNETTLQSTFVMSVQDGKFICEVILPEKSPVRFATGRPALKKSIAKRSAAFEACIMLRKGKYLDGNLLPTYTKQLPAMRNALLALSMKKMNLYDMRLKPSIWEQSWGTTPDKLFLTVLELGTPQSLGRPYQPLALLTRKKLPCLPPFLLHLDAGLSSQVVSTSMAISIGISDLELSQLTSFTLRIFRDVFNKLYEFDQDKMSYWLAPICWGSNTPLLDPETTQMTRLIDWKTINIVHNNEQLDWNMTLPHEFLADKFLIDRWDGGRRFFSVGVAPEYKPSDPVPPDTASGKYMKSILDYSVSLFAKSRVKAQWLPDQPVILAQKVLHRRNLLDEITKKERILRTKCYLCPEPLKFSALPTSVASMCLIFPAIISRLESYLVALEACQILHLEIKPEYALEAITKDSDNTEEHRNEQVHFQRGMGKNYERLEFIGDCFLKMATSISLFAQNPDKDEFEYHIKRMLLICNKNLFNTAIERKLYMYIRSQSFSRRTWYPEGLKLLEGKGYKKMGKDVFRHSLGDKTIADVCEALIGAALVSDDYSGNMDSAVRAVTELVRSPDHDMLQWTDYYKVYNKPTYQTASATASQLNLAQQVESEHDYHFQYPRLLRSSFIHPSYPFSWEKVPCYQRLEFLGDALLDMACINFLFYRFPDRDPQWLTEHKMAMVSNKFLGALCVKLGFHRHLRANGALVEFQVREYVTEISEAETEAQGARDYWTHVKNPPKCLPDVVEAYLGAVFVDSEFNYKEVERFFDQHVKWFFEDMSIYDTFANNHPTTFLNNLLSITFGCQNFRVFAQEIPTVDGSTTKVIAAVMIHDEIVAEGCASSGRYAKVKASSNALEKLNCLAPYEYRAQYHCDCSKGKGPDEISKEIAELRVADSAI